MVIVGPRLLPPLMVKPTVTGLPGLRAATAPPLAEEGRAVACLALPGGWGGALELLQRPEARSSTPSTMPNTGSPPTRSSATRLIWSSTNEEVGETGQLASRIMEREGGRTKISRGREGFGAGAPPRAEDLPRPAGEAVTC